MTASQAGAVFAVVQLSHLGKTYLPGERIDEAIPADIVAGCVERGEASREKPKRDSVIGSDGSIQPADGERSAPEPAPDASASGHTTDR